MTEDKSYQLPVDVLEEINQSLDDAGIPIEGRCLWTEDGIIYTRNRAIYKPQPTIKLHRVSKHAKVRRMKYH